MRLYSSLFFGILAIAMFLSGVLTPISSSLAGSPVCPASETPSEGISGVDFLTFDRSIVPCGRSCDIPSTSYDEAKSCTLCHLLIMIKNIFDLLFAWLIIVALVLITIGGVTYIISSGNPGLQTTAKGMITKTLTGFAVFILSWLIVYTVLVFISAGNNSFGLSNDTGNWFRFDCETTSPFD